MTASDELGALASLAGLRGMGPRRLAAVLAEWTPASAWEAICAGRLRLRAAGGTAFPGRQLDRLGRVWAADAQHCRPDRVLQRCQALDVQVLPYGSVGYPERLRLDPEPPLVLFARGDLRALGAPAVAVVGTRRASRYGLDAAVELAADLADAGVAVVSGLAVGIDAAAHRGALGAGGAAVVGVVGSGLDVVYPRRHADLWREVAERGLLLSEAPPGTPPEPWRFPARNRIIAGLAEVVVVVESPLQGGSMITAEEAIRRDRPVMAVPGSIHSPLSVGPNTLICDGGSPVRSADDVLARLGWPNGSACGPRRSPGPPPPSVEEAARGTAKRTGPDTRSPPPPAPAAPSVGDDERCVLDALGWEQATLDDVARRAGLALPTVVVALEALIRRGEVERTAGVLRRARRRGDRVGFP